MIKKHPSLTALRNYIRINGWNGNTGASEKVSNAEMFRGECHNAACALSSLLIKPEGSSYTHSDLVVRGWYKGEITATDRSNPCHNFHPTEEKHAHSWVVLKDGTILDPTWFQFTDTKPRMMVFPANDSRFEADANA